VKGVGKEKGGRNLGRRCEKEKGRRKLGGRCDKEKGKRKLGKGWGRRREGLGEDENGKGGLGWLLSHPLDKKSDTISDINRL
jgi:hypothetical protein